MTDDERTYTRWYEGKTFKMTINIDEVDTTYFLGELIKADILIDTSFILVQWGNRIPPFDCIQYTLYYALDNIRRGEWTILD